MEILLIQYSEIQIVFMTRVAWQQLVNNFKSIVNDYVAAEQQFCNKLNFIHDKYTRVLQYSSTLSKPANLVTNQEIVKKLGTRS